jgi:8-oxo-dGTP diphosphatase
MDIPCVGAICVDNADRLLLIQRGRPPAEGLWSLPGGRIEPGETPQQAIVREVREETGLHTSVIRSVGSVHRTALHGDVYVIEDFLVACEESPDPVAQDDAMAAGFFRYDEARQLPLTEGLLEALSEWGVWPRQ